MKKLLFIILLACSIRTEAQKRNALSTDTAYAKLSDLSNLQRSVATYYQSLQTQINLLNSRTMFNDSLNAANITKKADWDSLARIYNKLLTLLSVKANTATTAAIKNQLAAKVDTTKVPPLNGTYFTLDNNGKIVPKADPAWKEIIK